MKNSTRKPMRKKKLESLLNDINNSISPDEIKGHVESSTLFKDQKRYYFKYS